MIKYMQTNILDMIEYAGEDNCKNILSTFVCPINKLDLNNSFNALFKA